MHIHAFLRIYEKKCKFRIHPESLSFAIFFFELIDHIDLSRKTTDIYIATDWSIIDQVQVGVLSLLKEKSNL